MLRRYLVREVVAPFLAWASLLVVLFFVMAFLRGNEFLLGSAVSLTDFVRFTVALVPQFIVQAIPIALLLAILLGLGRLSEDREVVAMQALGVSPASFLVPPMVLGGVLSLVMVVLSFTLQPWGMSSLRVIAQDLIRRNVASDVRSGTFHQEIAGFTVYAERVEPGNVWSNVLLFDGRDENAPVLTVAHKGKVLTDGALSAVTFELENGSAHRLSRATSDYTTLAFERGSFRADIGETFWRKNSFRSAGEEQSPLELHDSILQAQAAFEPALARKLEHDFHWRLGQLLMPLAFACVGTPLALSRKRAGRGSGFLSALMAYVAFYVIARVAMQTADAGAMPMWLAGQFANAVFIAVGFGLMRSLQHRGAA